MRPKKKRGKKKASASPSSTDVLDSASQPANPPVTKPLPAMLSGTTPQQPTSTGSTSARQPSSSSLPLSRVNQSANPASSESSSADRLGTANMTAEDSQQAVLANQSLIAAPGCQQHPALVTGRSESQSSNTAASAQHSTAHNAEPSMEPMAESDLIRESQSAGTPPSSVPEAFQASNVCPQPVHNHLLVAQQGPAEDMRNSAHIAPNCQDEPLYSNTASPESGRCDSQHDSNDLSSHADELHRTADHRGQLIHLKGYPPAAVCDWQVGHVSALH